MQIKTYTLICCLRYWLCIKLLTEIFASSEISKIKKINFILAAAQNDGNQMDLPFLVHFRTQMYLFSFQKFCLEYRLVF